MINIIGLGYIGLPTALMFAKSGIQIVGTDSNTELVASLNKGELTFEENGLEQLFIEAKKNGVIFTTEYMKADTYILAVPTPYMKSSKRIDPSYVIKAVEKVLEVCNYNTKIIIESTVAPGTIDKYIRPIIANKGLVIGEDIHILHAPERIIPGNMIFELENNSRTIGTDDINVGQEIKKLYASFCKSEILITDIRSAEMSKVVENTFRDINIAFANELAKVCHEGEMDVYEIIKIANMHPRVNILNPGPGVGGHCISVDPWFLVGDYPETTQLISTARMINDTMPLYVQKRIETIMVAHNIFDYNDVGFYGLAYKENVDDVRESPTLQLLEFLPESINSKINLYDPLVKSLDGYNLHNDFQSFVDSSKLVIVFVGHEHLKNNLNLIINKIILDTKNIINTVKTYKL